MLKEYNKLIIPDQTQERNDLEIDIEPNKDTIKLRINDKEAIIKFQDLYSVIFVIANPKQQDDMIPVKQTTMAKYTRRLKIRAKKDIKKGQEIIVHYDFDAPMMIVDALRGELKNLNKTKLTI